MKLTVKELVEDIANTLNLNMSEMGIRIGRGGGSSLGRTLRDESLKVSDLIKCLKALNLKLTVFYKGKKIDLE